MKRFSRLATIGLFGVLASAGWSHAQEAGGGAPSGPTWADFAQIQQSMMAMERRLDAVERQPDAASGGAALDQRLQAVEESIIELLDSPPQLPAFPPRIFPPAATS